MNRGRALAVVILLAGLGAAISAIWFQSRQMGRTITALTPPVADRIVRAPRAELIRLEPSSTNDAASTVMVHGSSYALETTRDITRARGLIHLRAALVHDSSYDWNAPPPQSDGDWEYLLVFSGDAPGQQTVRLAFDLKGQRMMLLDQGPVLSSAPLAGGLADFFSEQVAEPESSSKR